MWVFALYPVAGISVMASHEVQGCLAMQWWDDWRPQYGSFGCQLEGSRWIVSQPVDWFGPMGWDHWSWCFHCSGPWCCHASRVEFMQCHVLPIHVRWTRNTVVWCSGCRSQGGNLPSVWQMLYHVPGHRWTSFAFDFLWWWCSEWLSDGSCEAGWTVLGSQTPWCSWCWGADVSCDPGRSACPSLSVVPWRWCPLWSPSLSWTCLCWSSCPCVAWCHHGSQLSWS